jgi:hypothetical protein
MANTTNYNWETPDDTDLVKDGAAAIRTLGSSVDTTTKALNPETTLGDIAYRSATSNTNTRLAIGSAGQVLTVAAGVPSWAAPAGGNTNPAFTAYRATSNQTLTSAVATKIAFNAEDFDTNNNFDSTTNYRFTPTTAGYYLLSSSITFGGTLTRVQLKLYKNGSAVYRFIDTNGSDNTGIYNGTALVNANGSSDYFEMYAEFTGTSPLIVFGKEYSYFNGVWVRS